MKNLKNLKNIYFNLFYRIDYRTVDNLIPGGEIQIADNYVIHRYLDNDEIVLIEEDTNNIIAKIEKNYNQSLIFTI